MIKIRLVLAVMVVSWGVSGCAGIFGGAADSGSDIHVREDSKPNPNAKQEKYPIVVRINNYTDARQADSPRRLGVATGRVLGVTGKDLMLDREVTLVVVESLKRHLGESGLQMVEGEASKAQFQLSGSVKELSIDVKARDYANIAIESTLTEVASGKVIWSGVVVEKSDRFAGTSGNSKKDVADYLRKELGIVSSKTSESILSVLMASRPDLFNVPIGAKPILGVTLYANPAASAASAVAPAAQVAEPIAVNGTLLVSSSPSRAKVYVDGVYFGLTPLRAETGAGVHEVGVKLDGYRSASEKVSVRKGDKTELEMKLHR